ncbi:hypothetical protein BpHYR1_009676 [Brachionus plicatilis]|uniref:Chromo domain-containing protein n=1 Tax=Brachionus plicatilis TaxID=10195 RepID=A0A3M7T915_BRAPC|nr:hypothetical protein BpHYR1_009676 [Brachionus plicatilis]
MSELNFTSTESTYSEMDSISSTVRKGVRFHHPELLSNRQVNKLFSGFKNSATAVYCTHNPGEVASEVKEKITAGSIILPDFDIWLKNMCFLQWDPAERRICFSKEKFSLVRIDPEPEMEINMQEAIESSNEHGPCENLQEVATCSHVETIKNKVKDAKAVTTKKKGQKKLEKTILKQMDKLAEQFTVQTDSVIQDAAYEVTNIVGDRVKDGKKQLKLRWKDSNGTNFSDTWENASLVSFSNSFVDKYENRKKKEVILPEKRPYSVKKVVVNEESREVQETCNEYFNLQEKLNKLN